MKKETISSILIWTAIIAVIVGLIFAGRSCENRKDRLREEERQQEKIDMAAGKYLYIDKNNVYHIDPRCYRMDEDYFVEDAEGNERIVDAIYSSKREIKSNIHDWESFATHHQLCNKCFTDEMIRILDSLNYYADGESPAEEVVVVEEVVVDEDYDINDMVHILYVRSIHDGILSSNVTESRFRECMNDEEERKSFYDYAINHGMDLPNYKDFCNKYK